MNYFERYQKNNIIFKSKDFAIYVPHPNEIIGISSVEYNQNLLTIQQYLNECVNGNFNFTKYLFFLNNECSNEWWSYLKDYKFQFLSLRLIDEIINDLKLTFNKYNYLIKNDEYKTNLYSLEEIKLFFLHYDFCNQVLASGKYFPNPSIDQTLSLLSNQIILDLMHNHIVILQNHLKTSKLQADIQPDVVNHILTHIIFTYWDFQNYITV